MRISMSLSMKRTVCRSGFRRGAFMAETTGVAKRDEGVTGGGAAHAGGGVWPGWVKTCQVLVLWSYMANTRH